MLLIINNIRDAKRVLGGLAFLLAVGGLILSALMYGTIATTTVATSEVAPLNQEYIFKTSIVLLVGSLAFSFFITVIETQRLNVDPRGMDQRSQNQVRARFEEKLGKKDGGQ